MTIEEAKKRIEELEAERELLKKMVHPRDAEIIPIESVAKHPWVDSVFPKYSTANTQISSLLRTVLFGKCTGETEMQWRRVDPLTGKFFKTSRRRRGTRSDAMGFEQVEVKKHCAVNIKEMNSEQWDKYRNAFEKVMCALEEFVSDDWKEGKA